jgi:hypothetical protein
MHILQLKLQRLVASKLITGKLYFRFMEIYSVSEKGIEVLVGNVQRKLWTLPITAINLKLMAVTLPMGSVPYLFYHHNLLQSKVFLFSIKWVKINGTTNNTKSNMALA